MEVAIGLVLTVEYCYLKELASLYLVSSQNRESLEISLTMLSLGE